MQNDNLTIDAVLIINQNKSKFASLHINIKVKMYWRNFLTSLFKAKLWIRTILNFFIHENHLDPHNWESKILIKI